MKTVICHWIHDALLEPEYSIIYGALDQQQATADNPIYAKMGEFTNRYVGRRSPLGQFIRMRALFGRKTTIVATPEVIKGTRFYILLHKIS